LVQLTVEHDQCGNEDECGFPEMGVGGSVQVSVTQTATYTTSGESTTGRSWTYDGPLTVPPNKTYQAVISVSISTISVPYTAAGTFITQSGHSIRGSISGTYTGTSSYNFHTVITDMSTGADVTAQATGATTQAFTGSVG
jgi:hypothetical protein